MTTIKLHRNDLPAGVEFRGAVAVDTETLGLQPRRDRLCMVQLSAGDGTAHLVQFDGTDWAAPRLKAVLSDASLTKIFHFARFDMAVLRHYLGVVPEPLYCTKIASKLARTYTDRHGLKDLCGELLGIELSKQQQSSDWAAEKLTEQQKHYAASDVLHLHALRQNCQPCCGGRAGVDRGKTCFRFIRYGPGWTSPGSRTIDIFPIEGRKAAPLNKTFRAMHLESAAGPNIAQIDGHLGAELGVRKGLRRGETASCTWLSLSKRGIARSLARATSSRGSDRREREGPLPRRTVTAVS